MYAIIFIENEKGTIYRGKISVGAQRKNDVATLRKESLCAARETKGADLGDFDTKSLGF